MFIKRNIKSKNQLLKLGFSGDTDDRKQSIISNKHGDWFTNNELNKVVFVEKHQADIYVDDDNPSFTKTYIKLYPWIDKKGNCYMENWLKEIR